MSHYLWQFLPRDAQAHLGSTRATCWRTNCHRQLYRRAIREVVEEDDLRYDIQAVFYPRPGDEYSPVLYRVFVLRIWVSVAAIGQDTRTGNISARPSFCNVRLIFAAVKWPRLTRADIVVE